MLVYGLPRGSMWVCHVALLLPKMDGFPEIHTFTTFAYGVRLAIRLQRRKSLADLFAMASSLSCFNTFHILTG